MSIDSTKPTATDEQVVDAIEADDAGTASRVEAMRRREIGLATDDGDASHEGGMGAQGGAVDFGNPKNLVP